MNPTRWLGLAQILGMALQGAPEVINILPPKYHPLLHFIVSACQAAAAWMQRSYNPAGQFTPAPPG